MPTQVYPEDYSCIIEPQEGRGGLYIGNLEAAQNLPNLKRLGIKAVLTSCKGIDLGHPRTDIPYMLQIPGEDHEAFDLGKYFHQASDFINDCIQRTSIMIHCLAGVSRSVSFTIAYFIKHRGFPYQKAFDFIKSRRRIIHPNDGFIQQLKNFERQIGPTEAKSLSSSPSKRYIHQQSMSPSKRYTPNREVEAIIAKYENYKAMAYQSIKRNPEVPTTSIKRMDSYSTAAELDYNQFRTKRTSSAHLGHYEKPDRLDFSNYRKVSEFNPLENIQNKQNPITDIDKKIQEIRRKYQEYQTPSPATGLSRFASLNADENTIKGNTRDYGNYGREALCGDFAQTRLKRLTSFQDY